MKDLGIIIDAHTLGLGGLGKEIFIFLQHVFWYAQDRHPN